MLPERRENVCTFHLRCGSLSESCRDSWCNPRREEYHLVFVSWGILEGANDKTIVVQCESDIVPFRYMTNLYCIEQFFVDKKLF